MKHFSNIPFLGVTVLTHLLLSRNCFQDRLGRCLIVELERSVVSVGTFKLGLTWVFKAILRLLFKIFFSNVLMLFVLVNSTGSLNLIVIEVRVP